MTHVDPLIPEWEMCGVCGGDHWTREHEYLGSKPYVHPLVAAERARIREEVKGLDALFSQRASCCGFTIGSHYNRDGSVGGDLVPPHEPTIVPEEHGGLIARAAVLAIIDKENTDAD